MVDVVHDGADAWRRVCAGELGLLISDWEMPEMDGLDLCRLVRARSDTLYTYMRATAGRTGWRAWRPGPTTS
jgi:CheY-like chemotaxis protein